MRCFKIVASPTRNGNKPPSDFGAMTVERHLILQEFTLLPSAEWSPRCQGWLMCHVVEGAGYWLQNGAEPRQLAAGDGVVVSRNPDGAFRASQLGPLKLQFFAIHPQHLIGLLTVAEWHQFEIAPDKSASHVLVFTATEPVGQKFTRIAAQMQNDRLPMRCALLQLWANAVAGLVIAPTASPANEGKLHERFRQLVSQLPEVELAECSLADLAKQLNCSERHFSRLFREEFGVSLRARQIELRLQRARQLLADSNAKIINVAYESGYRHLGLFNAMFKKRFGMTPSECRQQNLRKDVPVQPRNFFLRATARSGILILMLCHFFGLRTFAQTNFAFAPDFTDAAPVFHVERYLVSGNSVLTPGDISGIFTNVPAAFGSNVTAAGVCAVLNDLQSAYRQHGLPAAAIFLSRQQVTNGSVQIKVNENNFPAAGMAAGGHFFTPDEIVRAFSSAAPTADSDEILAKARTALFQKMAELDATEKKTAVHIVAESTNAGPRFKVDKYIVMGDSILTPGSIAGIFTNVPSAFGTNVSFDDIRAALGDLQAAYRERGFVTVSVGLPQQKLTNAAVKILVTEGRLAVINITGNRYFSSNNVMRALPDLQVDMILNSRVFQRELDNANASRDRQIYPVIGPGPEPGTSELTLKVKDRLPLHARLEINNQSTPGTPDTRVNFSAQYDNLWDLEHQIGLQYGFSEQRTKDSDYYSKVPLDEPLIANYSGYYRMPLGKYTSVQRQVDDNPSNFGYDEATHQFRVPPATGRPEATFYASRSVSDTGINFPPLVPVGVTPNPNFTILTNNSGDVVTLNEDLGARFSMPLPLLTRINWTLSFGLDYKIYQSVSFQTNNAYFKIQIGTDPMTGLPIYQTSIVNNFQPPHFTKLNYLPFNVGLNGSLPDKQGTTFFNANANFNVLPGFSTDADFAKASYTSKARADYLVLQFGANREQRIYKDWSVLLLADGQWADGALISNEQYAMGGVAGVRGYTDGEAYGDTGWRATIEPQTPPLDIGMVGMEGSEEPCSIRGSVFMDYGEIYLLQPAASGTGSQRFLGAGFGLTANIGSRVDGRLTIAWPVLTTPGTTVGDFHIYFGVGAQF
jgi:hemolysin activation/secretion protein/AraC-like DNA-binding protein